MSSINSFKSSLMQQNLILPLFCWDKTTQRMVGLPIDEEVANKAICPRGISLISWLINLTPSHLVVATRIITYLTYFFLIFLINRAFSSGQVLCLLCNPANHQ